MSVINNTIGTVKTLLSDPTLAEERAHIILNMPLSVLADPVKRTKHLATKLIGLQQNLNRTKVLK